MVRIWGQTDLYSIFPLFFRFGTSIVFLTKVTCPIRVRKHMVVIRGVHRPGRVFTSKTHVNSWPNLDLAHLIFFNCGPARSDYKILWPGPDSGRPNSLIFLIFF